MFGKPLRSVGVLALTSAIVLSYAQPRPHAQTDTERLSVELTQRPDLRYEVWPADFNGDGITDLVGGARTTQPHLLVLLGRGDGTFDAPQPIASGVERPVGVGDLNGDGFIDILAISATTTSYIIAGRGDGTFTDPAVTPVALSAPTQVLDMNDDNIADLVILRSGRTVVYEGHGDFTFTARTQLTTPNVIRSGLIVTDLNGDALPDVATSSEVSSIGLEVFLNAGGFTFTGTSTPLPLSGAGITARDVNSDGRTDIIVGVGQYSATFGWRSGEVLLFLGHGDGTFGAPSHLPSLPGPVSVVAGDFNGDGMVDIATGNLTTKVVCESINHLWDSVSIHLGRGDGTFAPAASFALGDTESFPDTEYKNRLHRLNTSDLNQDGRTDLIVSPGALIIPGPPSPNQPPVADAGPDRIEPSVGPGPPSLRGSATDPDHDWLSFQWRDSAGNLLRDNVPLQCVQYSGVQTFTLTVSDGHGGVATDSMTFAFTSGVPTPPAGLSSTTIGEADGHVIDNFGGAFSLVNRGADIWGTADAFQFAHQLVSGDFDVAVRVASVQNVDPWTKAGLMIRQSLAANSRHAAIFATPATTHGVAFQSRLQDGGSTTHVAGPAMAPPVWLRLQRRGDTITAFSRPTTADPWLEVGTRTLSGLLDPVYVGAALTSHRSDVLAMARFEGLTLTPVASGPSPDGTEAPPATHVTDAAGFIWTLGTGGETLRNGSHAGGGYGLSLLWTGGTLYTFASDQQWWRWTGTGWVVHGPTRPGTGGPNSSPDGTEVPPATRVIDTAGASWTLGPAGETLRDGSHAAGGYGLSLLWTGGTLYTFASDNQWWRWTGTGWTVHGPARPGSGGPPPSPDGTELPPATRVIDAAGAAWTLGPGGETLREGIHVGGGYGVSLLWTGGMLYTFASDDQWWQWTGTGWAPHEAEKPGT